MENEEFHFFWDGPFSQWHPSPMTIDGGTYNCAEQYMMYIKAQIFEDEDTATKIMESQHPAQQKALGRKVKNFDKKKWDAIARLVVYKGNMNKFQQNDELRERLMETTGTIVEASPHDPIWGIGLSENDPRCKSRDTWQGTNWLGEVVTAVREQLKKDMEND
jgi:ribA/ribD-fused uncharacterized protein